MTKKDTRVEALRLLLDEEYPEEIEKTLTEQLSVFAEALAIMVERTKEIGGELWREVGSDDTAHHIRHKAQRLYHAEMNDGGPGHTVDSALDLINYAGFYVRQKEDRG